ncbi:hypothetical protein [Leptolyngbya sp. FACHB-711]|uniref:hypothetical protein n=1 Tax=Leptolyngbya sp. FACHB-711 TaxID=2692813 RepID=UPI001689684E|nr:hypothetical protein [Leptolyngbya sp. FACHB-711]MBD2027305.1 hypothetical protein [Leptolyngbya sp. FACHB-711]
MAAELDSILIDKIGRTPHPFLIGHSPSAQGIRSQYPKSTDALGFWTNLSRPKRIFAPILTPDRL